MQNEYDKIYQEELIRHRARLDEEKRREDLVKMKEKRKLKMKLIRTLIYFAITGSLLLYLLYKLKNLFSGLSY
jgi:polyferredoxin